MKKIAILTFFVLLIFVGPVFAEEVIVVKVQDYELTQQEFSKKYQAMKNELNAPEEATDGDVDLYITNIIVGDFIVDSLIRIDIKEKKVQADQKEIDEELNNIIKNVMSEQEVNTEEAAWKKIKEISGLTKEELEKETSRNISFIKLQLIYFQKAQEKLTKEYIQSEYEDYLDQTEDPVSLEEFTENITLQKTNDLLQERINYLFEQNKEEIEINI